MTESKRGSVLSGLAGNLVVFIVLPLVLNGVIFGLGWNRGAGAAKGQMAGIPPGWVVGTIWMLLFTAMGVARWLLIRRDAGRLVEGPSLLDFCVCCIRCIPLVCRTTASGWWATS